MPVENVIITEETVSANRKKLQPVGVIRMLIGLTDTFVNHTSQKWQKVMVRNDGERAG